MKINNYLPNLYKNNVEMNNIINSEEIEFENNLKPSIDREYANNFITTCDIKGLYKYNKLFNSNIIIDENDTSNIDYLKNYLISRIAYMPIITYRWFESIIRNFVGENNYRINMYYNIYTLYLSISLDYWEFLKNYKDQIRQDIPSNLILDLRNFGTNIITFGNTLRQKDYIKINVRSD